MPVFRLRLPLFGMYNYEAEVGPRGLTDPFQR